jgi:hypothetical protein
MAFDVRRLLELLHQTINEVPNFGHLDRGKTGRWHAGFSFWVLGMVYLLNIE